MKKKERKYPELNKVKGKMRELGITFRSLAKITGLSLNTVNDKLNGHSLCDVNQAVLICSVLGIELDEIRYYFEIPQEFFLQ